MDDFASQTPAWRQPKTLAIIAVIVAIAVTAIMDMTGYADFSALPLAPIMGLFWLIQRNPRAEIGFRFGPGKAYALAFLYPLFVLSTLAALAYAGGDLALGEVDTGRTLSIVAQIMFATFVLSIITEEGFFRGWLWASLGRAGFGTGRIIIATSVAFMLWHVAFATLAVGYVLPLAELPVFLGNVLLLGIAWALMRQAGGSIIVSALAHGVWNGLVYGLFGIATHSGALGIQELNTYGPETGWLGLLMNATATYFLWRHVMGPKPEPS